MPSRSAACPECQVKVELAETVEMWDMVLCPSCGTELELVNLNPPELDYWYDPDYDDGYEYEDFEDES